MSSFSTLSKSPWAETVASRYGSNPIGHTLTHLAQRIQAVLRRASFLLVHNQNTGTSFGCRNFRIYQSFTHHRTTADNLTRIFGQTASKLQSAASSAYRYGCQEIGRLCQRLTSHGNDTLKQRFVLLYGLVNGKCGTYILNYHSPVEIGSAPAATWRLMTASINCFSPPCGYCTFKGTTSIPA